MFRVLSCVFEQHDLKLAVLASLLCLFACTAAMSMIRQARASDAYGRCAWLAGAGIVAGCGIWGTHFIAMLAYTVGFPVAFDIGDTVLSAAIAIAMCGVGFMIALSRLGPAVGGAVAGASIGAMHYVGMAAVRAPADAIWDWRYVVASAVIGSGLMAAGMAHSVRRGTVRAYISGTLVFTLAICSMHFTGMSAVTYRFNPTVDVPDAVVVPGALALAVAAIAVLIVALGLIGAIVDGHLKARERGEAERLRAHIAELEATRTALEESSRNLRLARDEAREASRAKSAFLAAMSHELRTPLNAVLGFSEIMAAEAFGPLGNRRYKEYASDIHSSGSHLLSLINDILDLSRIDAGEGKLTEEDVDLREVIAQSLRMVNGAAQKVGLLLEAAIAPDLPHVHADERRLKQALINLLGNAVKFTPAKGSIRVSAWTDAAGVHVAVADTGIGIALGDIPRALERFGQVDSTLGRKYNGAGLGLPLAKQFMELHGGSLTLESVPNIGTTVTLRLPRSRILPAKAADAAA